MKRKRVAQGTPKKMKRKRDGDEDKDEGGDEGGIGINPPGATVSKVLLYCTCTARCTVL
jgi:hypothetical protein